MSFDAHNFAVICVYSDVLYLSTMCFMFLSNVQLDTCSYAFPFYTQFCFGICMHLPVWIYVYNIYIYICNDAYIRTHVIIHLYMNTFADTCIRVSSFLWVSTGHLMPNLLRCTHDASCRHLERFRTQWGLDSLSRGP